MSTGIIGYGRIGAEHSRWIAEAGGVVTGVADVTAARREMATAAGFRAVESAEALLDDRGIDALLITTPTAMHCDQAMAALAAGKHVMVEKPMALDGNQARRMVEEADRRGLVLGVFHNRRWDVDYLTVVAAMRSGKLGKVWNVESRLGQFASCVGPAAPQWRPNWRNEKSFGGGGLYDWGSHFIDQLWRLMWPAIPVRVFAQLRGNHWSGDCDDWNRVAIDFSDGAAGLMEINTITRLAPSRWRIDAEHGSLVGPHSAGFDTRKWGELDFHAGAGAAPERLALAGGGLDEAGIWRRFMGAMRGEAAVAVSGRSALPTMALLDAARRSSDTGEAVAIDATGWVLD